MIKHYNSLTDYDYKSLNEIDQPIEERINNLIINDLDIMPMT